MKHFLDVQNGSVFVSFLCIFTTFFLILLTKRAFLRLLSCIFTNQKNYRQSTRHCRQQHADKHFSRQKAGIPSAGNFFHSYFFIGHHTFRPPATFFRRQPDNTFRCHSFFLTSTPQPTTANNTKASANTHNTDNIFSYRANLSLPTSSNLTFTNLFQLSFIPPSNFPISSSLHHPPLSINLPQKN